MALPKLLQAVLILSLIPAAAYAVATVGRPNHPSPASTGLATLSVTAYGDATAIGDMANGVSVTRPEPGSRVMPVILPVSDDFAVSPPSGDATTASVSIIATVIEKSSSAVIAYTVTGSRLRIDGNDYQIVSGTGIFNQHSLVVVLHAAVTMGDWTGMLILIGHADQALSDAGDVGVTFDSPQSKLASKFFLELTGTLTLS